MQNVSKLDNIIASFASTPLSINTMKFESLVLGTLLNSDVDNEVVVINVQIEKIMLLNLFMIFMKRQKNDVRCLNHCPNHRCQIHQKWRKYLHNHAKKSLWNDYLKPNPLLGKEFLLMFCISHRRFEKSMQDIMGKSNKFLSFLMFSVETENQLPHLRPAC